MFNLLQTFEHIRTELTLEKSTKPHIQFQLVKGFINAISTDDHNQIHTEIVRSTLNSLGDKNPLNKKNTDEKTIVSVLARKLNEHCNELKVNLSWPQKLIESYNYVKNIGDQIAKDNPSLEILELPFDSTKFENLFVQDQIFLWDKQFFEYIKKLGRSGKKQESKLKNILQDNYKNFKDNERNPLSFWFNLKPTSDKPFYHSEALQILSYIIWEEEVCKNSNFLNYGVPALTNIVQPKITKMLSHQNKTKDLNKEQIILFDKQEKEIIGTIPIPVTSPKIIEYIRKGLKEFDSLTAHRITRHLIKWPFEKKMQGIAEPRLLRFDRGFTEIAEKLGLNIEKNRTEITKVKHIIYALDHFKFSGPEITSRLINLAFYKSPITHRKEGCEITVLSPLLPYRTFEDGGLLIPLLNEPPLVGHQFYHAREFNLQWYLIAEFSNQSIYFAKNGVIQINNQKWNELLNLCDIPIEFLSKIQNSWTGDEGFLEKIEKDFYTLKKDIHEKELMFLKQQGERRIKGRENALIAIENKKKNK